MELWAGRPKLPCMLEESVITYIVQRGDTLSNIAFAYGTTVNQLMRRNKLDNRTSFMWAALLIPNLSQVSSTGPRRTSRIQFSWPVQGKISSGYGWRTHPILRVRHFRSVDIAASRGRPLRQAAPGKVVSAGSMGAFGLAVVIDHGNGYSSWYGTAVSSWCESGDSQGRQRIAPSRKHRPGNRPALGFPYQNRGIPCQSLRVLP